MWITHVPSLVVFVQDAKSSLNGLDCSLAHEEEKPKEKDNKTTTTINLAVVMGVIIAVLFSITILNAKRGTEGTRQSV
jgi:hypothetical protein